VGFPSPPSGLAVGHGFPSPPSGLAVGHGFPSPPPGLVVESGVPPPPPVLVVEHDSEVGEPLVVQLAADGYSVRLARTAAHARSLARAGRPAVAVLGDLEPAPAALELLAEIRSGEAGWPCALPVIVVSSRSGEPDELRAFEAGADDFLARPAPYLPLRARLRALLARVERGRGEPPLEVGELAIDSHAHTVLLHGRPVVLRPLEYDLLVHLARDPWRVCPRQELLRAVWGGATGSPRTLDSHASRLRRRLRAVGPERWVVGVRGVGYRLL
jgi:DNA-binding response OmpR family regulator